MVRLHFSYRQYIQCLYIRSTYIVRSYMYRATKYSHCTEICAVNCASCFVLSVSCASASVLTNLTTINTPPHGQGCWGNLP